MADWPKTPWHRSVKDFLADANLRTLLIATGTSVGCKLQRKRFAVYVPRQARGIWSISNIVYIIFVGTRNKPEMFPIWWSRRAWHDIMRSHRLWRLYVSNVGGRLLYDYARNSDTSWNSRTVIYALKAFIKEIFRTCLLKRPLKDILGDRTENGITLWTSCCLFISTFTRKWKIKK